MKTRHFSLLPGKQLLGQIIHTGEGRKTAPLPERIFDYYALVLVVEGEGWFRDDRHPEQHLVPGDLFLIFPGVSHSYGPRRGGNWHEVYIVFTGPIFDLWRKLKAIDPQSPIFHTASPVVWKRRLESVLLHHELHTDADALVEITRLQQLLAELRTGHQDHYQLRPGDRNWIASVKNFLRERENLATNLETIAARFNLTADAFRKRFTRTFGEPFHRYQNRHRLDRACRLLMETRLTNRAICEQLGYCDEFYFCRAFKKATGYPPSEYRRALNWQG